MECGQGGLTDEYPITMDDNSEFVPDSNSSVTTATTSLSSHPPRSAFAAESSEMEDSGSTRLGSDWSNPESYLTTVSPVCKELPAQTSAVKSILKNRNHQNHGTVDSCPHDFEANPGFITPHTNRNLSKSVTFKLPLTDSSGDFGNSTGSSSVLALETPEHLWNALPPYTVNRRKQERGAEGMAGREEGGVAGREEGGVAGREEEGVASSSVLALETPGHLWHALPFTVDRRKQEGGAKGMAGREEGGVAGREDGALTVAEECYNPTEAAIPDKSLCKAHDTSDSTIFLEREKSLSGSTTAWESMQGKLPQPWDSEDQSFDIKMEQFFSQNDKLSLLDTAGEGISILAMETPAFMWASPPINFINSTFN